MCAGVACARSTLVVKALSEPCLFLLLYLLHQVSVALRMLGASFCLKQVVILSLIQDGGLHLDLDSTDWYPYITYSHAFKLVGWQKLVISLSLAQT